MAVSGTLVKRIMVRVTADDMDADEKLDAITAKADELAAKNPELKVKIDSAAAMAKMKVLRDELKASMSEAVTVDPAAQKAAEDNMSRLADALDKMHERADKLKEAFAGDKEQLAKLLGLDAEVKGMDADLGGAALDPVKLARMEAQLAGVDAQFDKLRARPGGAREAFAVLERTVVGPGGGHAAESPAGADRRGVREGGRH